MAVACPNSDLAMRSALATLMTFFDSLPWLTPSFGYIHGSLNKSQSPWSGAQPRATVRGALSTKGTWFSSPRSISNNRFVVKCLGWITFWVSLLRITPVCFVCLDEKSLCASATDIWLPLWSRKSAVLASQKRHDWSGTAYTLWASKYGISTLLDVNLPCHIQPRIEYIRTQHARGSYPRHRQQPIHLHATRCSSKKRVPMVVPGASLLGCYLRLFGSLKTTTTPHQPRGPLLVPSSYPYHHGSDKWSGHNPVVLNILDISISGFDTTTMSPRLC